MVNCKSGATVLEQGALGETLHALSCGAGYNIRWLMRAIVRLTAKRSPLALNGLAFYARTVSRAHKAPRSAR
jgi:IS5 family transposase